MHNYIFQISRPSVLPSALGVGVTSHNVSEFHRVKRLIPYVVQRISPSGEARTYPQSGYFLVFYDEKKQSFRRLRSAQKKLT